MAKNILALASSEALSFFMQSENYFNQELPKYINFAPMLREIERKIGSRPFADCCSGINPADTEAVNFTMLCNKDGKYAVRPKSLINPYLYYFLCREICIDKNWQFIKNCFKDFTVPNIKACALPLIPEKEEPFYHSTTVMHWWNSIEQGTLELSLEYRYMFISDITNCYGSVSHQDLRKALCRKGTAREDMSGNLLAGAICYYLGAMQEGRNSELPQCSTVSDFIAEIILGYADLLLSEKLTALGITCYRVLRYRDDYRIFSNNKEELETISYELQRILEKLSFRMNPGKTSENEDLVLKALKADKLYYIENTPVFNKKGCDFDGIEKHLFFILQFGRKFPNSGQVKTLLNDLDKRIEKRIEDGIKIQENLKAMVAVLTQIALDNVLSAQLAIRTASLLLNQADDIDAAIKICALMVKKILAQPNSDYTQIWLQDMTVYIDHEAGLCPYNNKLCRIVAGEDLSLWNSDWLKAEARVSEKFVFTDLENEKETADDSEILTKVTVPLVRKIDVAATADYADFSTEFFIVDEDAS
ncbi:MAG: RNA-directed DNA polymerase [Succinivibrio sp.]|nr:RNA-directed DNA polymerase [Succinivibrio sp.]